MLSYFCNFSRYQIFCHALSNFRSRDRSVLTKHKSVQLGVTCFYAFALKPGKYELRRHSFAFSLSLFLSWRRASGTRFFLFLSFFFEFDSTATRRRGTFFGGRERRRKYAATRFAVVKHGQPRRCT